MNEINFFDGYYRDSYKEENTQVYLNGVHYDRGGLVFKFHDQVGNIYDKSTREALEMLILSEILFGSELWKYKASLSRYESTYSGTRNYVSIVVWPDESFSNS